MIHDELQQKHAVTSQEVLELENELSSIAESRINAWLSILTQALRLRESERRSICEELHEHIEERVHDLLVSGRGEADAVGQAIAELGDAAELAHRYGKANQQAKNRRITMNFGILGIGVGIMAVGTMVFSPQDSNIDTSVFQENLAASASIEVADNQRLSIQEDTDLAELLDMIDQVTEQKVIAHWGAKLCLLASKSDGLIADLKLIEDPANFLVHSRRGLHEHLAPHDPQFGQSAAAVPPIHG